jgi:DNA-binding NarL/FixJ family response regulator
MNVAEAIDRGPAGPSRRRTRVLLVDDQPIAITGITSMLMRGAGFDVVDALIGTDEVVERCVLLEPDIVLMDAEMEGVACPIEMVTKLRRALPRLPVLLYGPQPEEDMADACLRAGATGYVSRSGPNLLFAIAQIARGERYPGPEPPKRGICRGLTAREFQVYLCLTRGLQVRQIAKRLGIRANSVQGLRRGVCRKTGLTSNPKIILHALESRIADPEGPREYVGSRLASMPSPDELEDHPDVGLCLSSSFRITRVNAAWRSNALAEPLSPSFLDRWGPGADLFDAIPIATQPFYRSLFESAPSWGSGRAPRTHAYECSSAALFRQFEMRIFRLPKDKGYLVTHHLLVERAHSASLRVMRPPDLAAFRGADGAVTECSNCRRARVGDTHQWSWVPAWISRPPGLRAFSLCDVCSEGYA